MKKFILGLLMTIVFSSGFIVFYLRNRDQALDARLIEHLKEEVVKEYPRIGYNFTLSPDGTLLTHPLLHQISDQKIYSLFEQSQEKVVTHALANLKPEHSVLLHAIKNERGHATELFLLNKDSTIYGLVFFPQELTKFIATNKRQTVICMSLLLLLIFCCLILAFGILFIQNALHWWFIIFIISCAMLIEIGYLWSLNASVGFKENLETIPVLSKSQEIAFFKKLELDTATTFITIPTGIYLEKAQFSLQGSDIYPGVYLKGYIWQQYTKDHATIEKEFLIANAKNIKKEKIYHQIGNERETLCWSFSCLLYQSYNPMLYPFDHRHIIINLLHRNFLNGVALTPDLASYQTLNPILLPGIDVQSVNFSHWNIIKSFFNFEISDSKTSFGSLHERSRVIPYLQFIVTAERKLGGSFTMYFVLLLVIFIILFILLMAFLKQDTVKELVGFSALSIVGACSGLLFVLITSEIHLRDALKTEGIVYLEMLYFICYLMIIMVIIDSIVFAIRHDINAISYQDNLIFKLLYWPLTLFSIIVATAYAFY